MLQIISHRIVTNGPKWRPKLEGSNSDSGSVDAQENNKYVLLREDSNVSSLSQHYMTLNALDHPHALTMGGFGESSTDQTLPHSKFSERFNETQFNGKSKENLFIQNEKAPTTDKNKNKLIHNHPSFMSHDSGHGSSESDPPSIEDDHQSLVEESLNEAGGINNPVFDDSDSLNANNNAVSTVDRTNNKSDLQINAVKSEPIITPNDTLKRNSVQNGVYIAPSDSLKRTPHGVLVTPSDARPNSVQNGVVGNAHEPSNQRPQYYNGVNHRLPQYDPTSQESLQSLQSVQSQQSQRSVLEPPPAFRDETPLAIVNPSVIKNGDHLWYKDSPNVRGTPQSLPGPHTVTISMSDGSPQPPPKPSPIKSNLPAKF